MPQRQRTTHQRFQIAYNYVSLADAIEASGDELDEQTRRLSRAMIATEFSLMVEEDGAEIERLYGVLQAASEQGEQG